MDPRGDDPNRARVPEHERLNSRAMQEARCQAAGVLLVEWKFFQGGRLAVIGAMREAGASLRDALRYSGSSLNLYYHREKARVILQSSTWSGRSRSYSSRGPPMARGGSRPSSRRRSASPSTGSASRRYSGSSATPSQRRPRAKSSGRGTRP